MWGGTAGLPANLQNPGNTATSEEEQLAQANQDFWNQQQQAFNPQSVVQTATPSAPQYNNIASQAGNIVKASMGGGMPTGSANYGQEQANIGQTALGASKTEDLNNFLNTMNANQASGANREASMFNRGQENNAKNNELFQTLPEQAGVSAEQNQQNIENMQNQAINEQPNPLNALGGAIGSFGGKLAGGALGNSLFGQTPAEEEENT